MPSRQRHLTELTRPPPSSLTPGAHQRADKDWLATIRAAGRTDPDPVVRGGQAGPRTHSDASHDAAPSLTYWTLTNQTPG